MAQTDKEQYEDAEVQLAGCLTAAEGWYKDAANCPLGRYGHSEAYGAVSAFRGQVQSRLQRLNPKNPNAQGLEVGC
jgi:hypothetical protein